MDIEIKLGPVTNFGKKNTATSKKLRMMSCQQFVTSLSFSRFMVNLEQSGSWIPDAWSVIFTFSVIVTFSLTKIENSTKKL